MTRGSWYAIKNASDGEAEISIYDEIGFLGVSPKDFIADLQKISAPRIAIRIHSPGGSVFDGYAIYNAIRRHPARKTSYIDGLAASMATMIALAADRVVMSENALFMIHNPWGGATGDAEEMTRYAETLSKIKNQLLGVYEKKTGLSEQQLSKMMDDEAYLTAREAFEFKFIDEISEPVMAAATLMKDLMRFMPRAARPSQERLTAKSATAAPTPAPEKPATPVVITQKPPMNFLAEYLAAKDRNEFFQKHRNEILQAASPALLAPEAAAAIFVSLRGDPYQRVFFQTHRITILAAMHAQDTAK